MKKSTYISYGLILIGSLAMSIGVVSFLSPNHITTGGTAGMAILFHFIFNLPIGLLMGLINLPLLVIGYQFLGKKFTILSAVCILLIMLFVDLFSKGIPIPKLNDNLLLATIYGGVFIGFGLGCIFKVGASAGGGTIIARIVSNKFSIKASSVLLFLDAMIVISSGLVFDSFEMALWSLISIYVTTKLIDTVLTGAPTQKIVHISSLKNLNELSALIHEQMGITGTIVKGNDLSNSEYKDIIFIMIDKTRLMTLKELVLSYDSQVKMIVMEASEILA